MFRSTTARYDYPDIYELDESLLTDPDEAPSPEASHWFGAPGAFDAEGLCPCAPRLYEVAMAARFAAYLAFLGMPRVETVVAYQHSPYSEVPHRKSYARRSRSNS